MKDKECPVKPVYDPEILPDMLPLYYKRLFPHDPYYRWLSYGNGTLVYQTQKFLLFDAQLKPNYVLQWTRLSSLIESFHLHCWEIFI